MLKVSLAIKTDEPLYCNRCERLRHAVQSNKAENGIYTLWDWFYCKEPVNLVAFYAHEHSISANGSQDDASNAIFDKFTGEPLGEVLKYFNDGADFRCALCKEYRAEKI